MSATTIESPATAGVLPATTVLSPQIRALAHDLQANYMLLEATLRRLKRQGAGAHGDFAQIEAILREARRLLDDLRLLGHSGEVPFEPSRLDLEHIVREILEEQAPLLAARNADVQVALPLPGVWCNEARLKQALTNLVRNAALHGCDRSLPRITISAAAHAARDESDAAHPTAAANWVWIRVEDNGPGIPAEFRRLIFQSGVRLAGTKAAGSGMGLATVADIVGHYGGAAWVDGRARGAALVCSFPAAPAIPGDTAGLRPHQPHHLRKLPRRGPRSIRREL